MKYNRCTIICYYRWLRRILLLYLYWTSSSTFKFKVRWECTTFNRGGEKNERSSFFVCLLLAFTNLADNNIDFDFIWMSWYDDLLRSASVHYAATKQVRFCLNNSQFLLRENHLPHSLLFYNDLWKSKDPNK